MLFTQLVAYILYKTVTRPCLIKHVATILFIKMDRPTSKVAYANIYERLLPRYTTENSCKSLCLDCTSWLVLKTAITVLKVSCDARFCQFESTAHFSPCMVGT